MSFDYLLTGVKINESNLLLRERNDIALLKQNLVNIGYNRDEVEYLVHQFTAGAKVKQLSLEELRTLKQSLQLQLELAKKCLAIP